MENLTTHYAQCQKTKNLYDYYWAENENLIVKSPTGDWVRVDQNDYKIIEIAIVYEL